MVARAVIALNAHDACLEPGPPSSDQGITCSTICPVSIALSATACISAPEISTACPSGHVEKKDSTSFLILDSRSAGSLAALKNERAHISRVGKLAVWLPMRSGWP